MLTYFFQPELGCEKFCECVVGRMKAQEDGIVQFTTFDVLFNNF